MGAKLKANPFSSVTVRYRGGEPVELRVWSVTKSRRATIHNIAKSTRPDFERLCKIATRARGSECGEAARSIEDLVVLAALGLWAPETDLIDPVLLEVPIRTDAKAPTEPWPADGFKLRGEVWLQHGLEPCDALDGIPLDCLSAARPILWHKGSDVEPALPWWPDAGCLAVIEAMQRGTPLRPDMLPSLQPLADQGIVMPRPVGSGASGDPGLVPNASREVFARDGFINLGRVLPRGQVAGLKTYWQKLAALQIMPNRPGHALRGGTQGEPSSVLLLHLMRPLVEHVVGTPIEPAYSYAWIYGRGAEMPAHRDREECRYTVSLLTDYAPACDGPTPWPLCIRPRGGGPPVEIRQSIGDALLFQGQELAHFRPPFTAGDRSTSLLLHYVEQGFSGKMF